MTELEYREFTIREKNDEERSVSGIAVPYNQSTNVGDYRESFEKGTFSDHEGSVPFFYGHDHRTGGLPIGKVAEVRETDEGLEVKAFFSQTSKGDEVYTLVRDGVLDKFSIGFKPVKSVKRDGVVVRTKGELKEVSIVPMPAYANAAVSEVRADNHNEKENDSTMSNDNVDAPEVAEIREAVSDLERKVSVLSNGVSATNASQYRSIAEIVKGFAERKADAEVEVRAWDGVSLADNDDATRPAWVNKALELIEPKRPFSNLFRKEALPATGMSYVYPYVSGVTGAAGVQVNEGDDLTMVQITSNTKTNSIVTIGVAASLSRQVIERSEVAMLETTLRHMYNEYAIATEKRVADAFKNAAGIQTAVLGGTTQVAHADADAFDWLEAVDDGNGLIDDNARGAKASVVVVSRDVFRSMVRVADSTGRPLFALNGDGVNTVGSLSVPGARGTISGLPVVVIPTLDAGSLFVVSGDALTVREDPFKSLQDENIINLTKDFSVYGYHSVDLSNALAIVRIDTDGVA